MGCSKSLAKIFLFVFNVVFFVFGVASLGVGIWVAVNRNELFKFVNLVDSQLAASSNREAIDGVANQHGLVVIAGFALIGIGVFTLLVGFCGCCGAVKESKCLLMIYAILVSLVLAAEAAAAILAAIFQNRIRAEAEKGLMDLQNNFFVSIKDYLVDKSSAKAAVTYLLNYVNVMFECCGAQSLGDIANSSTWQNSNRTWQSQELQVPITCCKVNDKEAVLKPDFDWNNYNSKLVVAGCPYFTNRTGMHTQTCYSSIINFVSTYSAPLIGVSVGIALFELFCVVVACCLYRAIDPSYDA